MSDSPLLGLKLQPGAATFLFEQICQALRRRITNGQLPPGMRLPPSRRLADELGVSRTTIISAYDQLIAEGYAASRPGSGLYVSRIGEVERRGRAVHSPSASPATSPDSMLVAPKPPAMAAIPVALPSESPPIGTVPRPFLHGNPDMRLFPYRQWGRCVSRIARTAPEALVRQGDPFGDPDLRAQICRYLSEWRGVAARPEQILITAGSGDALEICLRALLPPGAAVALENPGYPPLASFTASLGRPICWMQVDEQGAQLPEHQESEYDGAGVMPKLAVLTPSSQYPLGGAMPQARRSAFLGWAERTGAWIIEDDYDSEFRYAGQPIPALAGLDASCRTLYVGSFSKIFSHGFRLGFAVIPDQLIGVISDSLHRYGGKASMAAQRPLALFMHSGEFYRHIRRVRRIYAERRAVLTGLLRDRLVPVASFTDHRAGMQIAVRLPRWINDVKLSHLAASRGLTCPALSSYYAKGRAQNGLLLGFCGFTSDEIEAGFDILCDCLNAFEASRQ